MTRSEQDHAMDVIRKDIPVRVEVLAELVEGTITHQIFMDAVDADDPGDILFIITEAGGFTVARDFEHMQCYAEIRLPSGRYVGFACDDAIAAYATTPPDATS
jgi:hypothetical protein